MDYRLNWTTDQNGLQTKMDYRPKWITDQNGLQT